VVDELAEPTEVLPRALELAAELAAQSRGAYAAAKRDLRGDVIDRAERVVAEGSDPLLAGWLG
jgi:enoyl-CoA hydratase/carnithine racemase